MHSLSCNLVCECKSSIWPFLLSAVFEPFKDNKVELLMPKLVFLALNLGGLALGIWKVRKFFLFPHCFPPSLVRKATLPSIKSLNYCFLMQTIFVFSAQHFGASSNTCIRLGFVSTPSSGWQFLSDEKSCVYVFWHHPWSKNLAFWLTISKLHILFFPRFSGSWTFRWRICFPLMNLRLLYFK